MGRAHEVRAASMAKTAAIKSKLYSIYAKEIYQVAKNGGSNPDSNTELKRLIEKAKKEQVPTDVISRSIDKVNKGITEDYQIVEYECFGPGGSNFIIKCLTDNVNRTLSFVRPALTKNNAKMATPGAVSFMYDNLSIIGFPKKNEEEILELMINDNIEIIDIEDEEELTVITGNYNDYLKIKNAIINKYGETNFEIDEQGKYAKEKVVLIEEDLNFFKRMMSTLEEIEDVQVIYYNVENA